MSQFDMPVIDPDTDSGTDLANDLNSWIPAMESHHRGGTAPSYKVTGMIWIDSASAPTGVLVKYYDGTNWITLGNLNETTNEFIPYYKGAAIGPMALKASVVQAKSSQYNVVAGDDGSLFVCTTGSSFDLDLLSASSAGNGFYFLVYNIGSSGNVVRLDPNSTELINGSSTSLSIPDAAWGIVYCNGTEWRALVSPDTSDFASLSVANTFGGDCTFNEDVILTAGKRFYPKLNNAGSLGSTPVFNFDKGIMQTGTMSAAITNTTTSNRASGKLTEIRIVGDTVDRAVVWNSNWTWLGIKPSTIYTGKDGILALRCYGTAETDVVAVWNPEL